MFYTILFTLLFFINCYNCSIVLPLDVFQHPYQSSGLSSDLLPAFVHNDYHHHHLIHKQPKKVRTLYQSGISEKELPECEPFAVCSKVDLYEKGSPWVERQCKCPSHHKCSTLLTPNDGHTIVDKTRQFKLCEPVKKLPKCRYFRDITWTLTSTGNSTKQVVHCHCPKGSIAYLLKRQPFQTLQGTLGYHYSFACSPQSRLRCQRKEPCRLFTVRKRLELLDEVNTNTLCQCPHGHHCPRHHSDPGVIQGKSYLEENIRTYSGYCIG